MMSVAVERSNWLGLPMGPFQSYLHEACFVGLLAIKAMLKLRNLYQYAMRRLIKSNLPILCLPVDGSYQGSGHGRHKLALWLPLRKGILITS
jgi:hypothetical protein